jgi:hypothetical protein
VRDANQHAGSPNSNRDAGAALLPGPPNTNPDANGDRDANRIADVNACPGNGVT